MCVCVCVCPGAMHRCRSERPWEVEPLFFSFACFIFSHQNASVLLLFCLFCFCLSFDVNANFRLDGKATLVADWVPEVQVGLQEATKMSCCSPPSTPRPLHFNCVMADSVGGHRDPI